MSIFGKHTYGHQGLRIRTWNSKDGKLTVGNFCSFADGITIHLGGNHHGDWISTYPFHSMRFIGADQTKLDSYSKGNVEIKSDVWIGSGVLILSGITIGEGAVVAANSVVTKNVPPYTVIAGNPAVVKKYRFSPEQIESLLKIKWWNWDDKKIAEAVELLTSPNIDDFIKKYLPKS